MPKGLDYLINIKDGDLSGPKKARVAVSGLDDAIDRTTRNTNGFGSAIGKIGGLVAGAFAVNQVIAFARESRDAFMGGERAAAQVNQAIITTGGLAGQSLDKLRAKADEFETKTLFDNSEILGADSLLLTFTNIKGKIYDEAMPAILDMAQRMAGDGPADLKGASLQLGKALNDPIGGLNALRRVGVSFSDQQKDMIATAIKHGDVQKAQGIILGEVNKEFGGSAEAARKVMGPAADLAFQVGELKEDFGKLVNDGLNPVSSVMVDVVKGLREGAAWIGANKELIKELAISVGIGAAVYKTSSIAMGIYNVYQTATAGGANILKVAVNGLNTAWKANPIGIVIAGLGLVAAGATFAYQKFETFRAVVDGVTNVAKTFFEVVKETFGAFVGGFSKLFDGDIKGGLADIGKGLITANPIGLAITQGERLGDAFNKGYDDSMRASHSIKKKGTATDLFGKGNDTGDGTLPPVIPPTGGGSSTLAGGKSVRNVQVQFKNLVETLQVHTTNLQGGTADIKRQITELLVGVVHDSELALGSS
ncbi:MAG: hypothetical protein WKF68_02535 [Daejeonella sp.]